MLQRRRMHLGFEQLEGRVTPSLSVSASAGNLTLSGTPNATPAQQLLIQRTAGNTYQVTDGTANAGSYIITGYLRLNLTSYNTHIVVNLNNNSANPFAGSMYFNLGFGAKNPTQNDITIEAGTAGGSVGKINGSISFQGGSGQETVDINGDQFTPLTSTLNIGGSVSFTGNTQTGLMGNVLNIGDGAQVGTDVIATQANVSVGVFSATSGTSIGRNLSVNDASSGVAALLDITGRVGGNVGFTGSALNDSFTITGATGIIGGSVSANMGSSDNSAFPGGDFVSLDTGASVGGGFTVNGGSGSNVVNIGSTVRGSLNVTLGGGDNTVQLQDFASSTQGTVGGNATINVGNGNDTINLNGIIGGFATVYTGNGNNTIRTSANGFLGRIGSNATFSLGNGTNALTLASPGAGIPVVNGILTINGGTGTENITLSGDVNGSVAFNMSNGTNTVSVTGAVTGSSFRYTGGSGNDTVTLGGTLAVNAATFTMGTGKDRLDLSGASGSVGTLSIYFNGIYPNGSTYVPYNPATLNVGTFFINQIPS